jgi:predicted unusual protein kinase regulating ubiquinone biosynthesis (AarF/ABC1/UbiB family)
VLPLSLFFAGVTAAVEVAREFAAGQREGLPATEAISSLSPLALRRLFEGLGATYIKLGQVCSQQSVHN